ncbi:MarR family winged helix-turn-helix transcriptional regulator [Oceanospirillum beijerinckii]|uniref:MarR family winged helix-turn-helix transcriptional regulator n=1 Tax=Oceanospirillum beijerinckii TaxID=64976 RepID=UPI0003F9A989|nr:winged helix DNA-binding protein [Oceanospirillum beijerinckii]MAC46867.1 transcriptional regulator [Oceanospirillum sp.]
MSTDNADQHLNNVMDLNTFFPFRLSILEKRVSESIAQHYADRFNLTRYEWRVMATLAMHHTMSAKQVANFTRLDKMQVSRAISGLKSAELINQSKSEQDKRTSVLTLTDQGLALYNQIVPLVMAQEEKILQALSDEEQQTLHKLMQTLSSHAEDLIQPE